MKRILATLILVPAIAGAQNLVTNATMEKTGMAAFRPQIERAEGWSNANGGTADLFIVRDHACADGVPDNFMGTQDGGGENYAGIIAYYGDQRLNIARSFENAEATDELGYGKYTEYLQGELTQPLTAGAIYTFSFQVSLAEESDRAVQGLGAYFTTDRVKEKGNTYLYVDPQIVSREVIADEKGWVEIKGSFIARGGEKYVTIGVFPQYLKVEDLSNPNDNDSRKAYYYIARPNLTAGPLPKPPVAKTISSGAEDAEKKGLVYLGLNFSTGSSVIRPGDTEKLDAVVKFLRENPDIKVKVDGHTDAVGSAAANLVLSEQRALAVKAYLKEHNIASSRIEIDGYGEKYPIEYYAYESVRNRRIELYRIE
jgi:outer membrane protein OmpA-like peptidoglycan-associated protein